MEVGGGPSWSPRLAWEQRRGLSDDSSLQVMLHRRLLIKQPWALSVNVADDTSVVHSVLWLLLGPLTLTRDLGQRRQGWRCSTDLVLLRELTVRGPPLRAAVIPAPRWAGLWVRWLRQKPIQQERLIPKRGPGTL